jgi:hypothetical protein
MGKAAYCSECKGTVWMTETGCANGHPMSCLRNVHEADSIDPSAAPGGWGVSLPSAPDAGRLRSPRTGMAWWLKATLLTAVWVAVVFGFAFVQTDVIPAGQITRQQASEISRLFGVVCGFGIAGIWAFFAFRRAISGRASAEAKLAAMDPAVRASRMRTQSMWTAFLLLMIGLLTMFNAVQWVTGRSMRMVAGLISTRLLSFAVVNAGLAGRYVMLAAGIAAAVLFAVLGLLVYRGHLWALRVGVLLYVADALVLVIATGTRDVVGFAAHGLVVVALTVGYLVILGLRNAERADAVGVS